jgi:hypothetical protein
MGPCVITFSIWYVTQGPVSIGELGAPGHQDEVDDVPM